jgi:hypothetical protein
MNANSDAVNVISGNAGGVECSTDAQQNNVLGNYVGTDVTGTKALANGTGMKVGGTSNNIGSINGLNLVSGNTGDGILVTGSSINVVRNWVGVTIAGNVGLGNGQNGIFLSNASTATVTNNVIASNGSAGTSYAGLEISGSNNATVKGNMIGLGSDGTTVLGNNGDGIYIASSTGDTIGGNGADVNYIAGTIKPPGTSLGWAIDLAASATGNILNDNWVGYDKNGKLAKNQGGGVDDRAGGNTNNIPAAHVQP